MYEVVCKAKFERLVISLPNHSFFCLLSNIFSIALHTKLDLSHPLVLGVSHCIYNQPLDLMEIHLLRCTHGGERTMSHDIV